MIDEREQLGRVVRGFAPPEHAFERLVTRRRSKRRNQRLAAGAVGVLVALAVGIVLSHSLSSHRVPAHRNEVPAPAPAAPGTLSYVRGGDIYVADPDGSNVVKIADAGSSKECPDQQYWSEGNMWSPDGRYLAFRSSDCSGGLAPNEGEGVVITDVEGNVQAKFPTGRGWEIRWSPDSTRVAIWDDFGKTIGVYAPDGTRQTEIAAPGGGGGDTDPYWMPDGTALVVSGAELPLDGGAPLPAPPSFSDALDDPRVYSPDHSHFAYVHHRMLTVAETYGGGDWDVPGKWLGGPTWSLTGDRFAITAKGDGRSPVEMYILNPARLSRTLVGEGERGAQLEVVGFTPGGDRILYTTTDDTGWSLWSIGVDGSDARRIVDGTDGNFSRVGWPSSAVAIPTAPPTPNRVPASSRPVVTGPAPAPAAPGTLAYIRGGDVYVADPDGSNPVRITDSRSDGNCRGTDEYWTEGGLWSPDGRYLAVLRMNCSSPVASWDAVITDARGNVLATFPSQGWRPAWSPDSTRVAVWDTWPETIAVYGLDGVRQTRLAVPPEYNGGNDSDPEWMPDGASLAAGNLELPLDGGPTRRLPRLQQEGDSSPDGSLIAYNDHGSLMVARSDGSEPRKVFGAGAQDPAWSPAGDRLAFVTDGPAGKASQLRVLDVATGTVTLVIQGEHAEQFGLIGFSPDGDRILFSRESDGAEPALWSIGADGSDPSLVVAGTANGEWLSR